MVGVMVTSSKRTYVSLPCLPELLQSVPVTPQQATHTSTGDSWTGEASLAQSLVGPRLLSPGSWCTRFSLCPPRVSISPVLWKFCKQIPLAFKVKFPVGSQSLCPLFEKEKWFALYFLGLHNHYRRWLQHDIKRHLLLGRKAMTNPDSILRSRDITLLTKVHIVKAMVFVVVMDGCESWTIKKAEHWRMDVFDLWCCRRLLRVPWNCKEIQPVYPKGNQSWIFIGRTDVKAETPILWSADGKSWLIGKTLMLGKKARREGNNRWDSWMASLIQWT